MHIHLFSPMLILKGGVAHCDAPVEIGPTKFLPHSQRLADRHMAAPLPAFREYFEAHYVQLPLQKGHAIFFSPALFHAVGENRSADIARMVNLLRVALPFARHMETIDCTAMCWAVFPYLSGLTADALQVVKAQRATACSARIPVPHSLAPSSVADQLSSDDEENEECG
ncbi:phytanoyl-CoA dioxygenase family protein [Aestuariivirga sp.]|uniref:phytanoyl-CoA dioxygenase family protein n=1 Tax=Aestuariivirga sp. TaxID=2650926 RepID=UPI003BA92E18